MYFRIKFKQETDVLKNYLKKAQDDVTSLLDEKRMLLDTVRSLQVKGFLFDRNEFAIIARF